MIRLGINKLVTSGGGGSLSKATTHQYLLHGGFLTAINDLV